MSEQDRFDLTVFYYLIIDKDSETALSSGITSDFKPFEFNSFLDLLISEGYINKEAKNGKIYYVPTEKSISEYGNEHFV